MGQCMHQIKERSAKRVKRIGWSVSNVETGLGVRSIKTVQKRFHLVAATRGPINGLNGRNHPARITPGCRMCLTPLSAMKARSIPGLFEEASLEAHCGTLVRQVPEKAGLKLHEQATLASRTSTCISLQHCMRICKAHPLGSDITVVIMGR